MPHVTPKQMSTIKMMVKIADLIDTIGAGLDPDDKRAINTAAQAVRKAAGAIGKGRE